MGGESSRDGSGSPDLRIDDSDDLGMFGASVLGDVPMCSAGEGPAAMRIDVNGDVSALGDVPMAPPPRRPRNGKGPAVRIGDHLDKGDEKRVKLDSDNMSPLPLRPAASSDGAGPATPVVDPVIGFTPFTRNPSWFDLLPDRYWKDVPTPPVTESRAQAYTPKRKKPTGSKKRKSSSGGGMPQASEPPGDGTVSARAASMTLLDRLTADRLQLAEPCFEEGQPIWDKSAEFRADQLAICKRAVEADPTSPTARDEYSKVLLASGSFAAVIAFYKIWWDTLEKGWESPDFVRDCSFIQNCCTAYAKLGCYSEACHLIRSWSQRFNKQWKAVMCLDGYYDYIHALASESSGSHTEALEYAEKAIAKDEFVREASDPEGPVADPAHVQWNEYLEWLHSNMTDVGDWLGWLPLDGAHLGEAYILKARALQKLGRPAEALATLEDWDVPITAMNNTVHYLRQACLVDLGLFAEAAFLSAKLLELDATFRGHQTVPGDLPSRINGGPAKAKSGIDARHFGNQSRFANHFDGIAKRHNANIVSNTQNQVTGGEDPYLALQARFDITAGSEILVNYGKDYAAAGALSRGNSEGLAESKLDDAQQDPWRNVFFTNAIVDDFGVTYPEYMKRFRALHKRNPLMGHQDGRPIAHPLVEVQYVEPGTMTALGTPHPCAGGFRLVAKVAIKKHDHIIRYAGLRKECNKDNSYDSSNYIAEFA
eukprot:m.341196 g.341196  ORF g.341196 m.341196 type:complete len:709 (-) comp27837_c1_seq18:72-2198(-)